MDNITNASKQGSSYCWNIARICGGSAKGRVRVSIGTAVIKRAVDIDITCNYRSITTCREVRLSIRNGDPWVPTLFEGCSIDEGFDSRTRLTRMCRHINIS